MKKCPPLLALLIVLCGATSARAHDILQCSTAVWLRADRMDFDIVMSRTPARQLIPNPPAASIQPENFEEVFHPLLKAEAADLFTVVSNGETLKPRSADVELDDEMEIVFHLVYPLPAPGKLLITSPFVKKMDEGYTNTLSVNRARKNIGYADLTGDELTLELAVTPPEDATTTAPPPKPAPPPPPASPPVPPPTPAPVTAPATPPPAKPAAPPLTAMLTAVIILGVIWVVLRRQQR